MNDESTLFDVRPPTLEDPTAILMRQAEVSTMEDDAPCTCPVCAPEDDDGVTDDSTLTVYLTRTAEVSWSGTVAELANIVRESPGHIKTLINEDRLYDLTSWDFDRIGERGEIDDIETTLDSVEVD